MAIQLRPVFGLFRLRLLGQMMGWHLLSTSKEVSVFGFDQLVIEHFLQGIFSEKP
jgi:hypothetical protein